MGVPYMHALYVCLICVPYMLALYAYLICMPYMYALYVCLICIPYMHPLYASLICMPYKHALNACLECMPYMYSYMYALYVGLLQATTSSRPAEFSRSMSLSASPVLPEICIKRNRMYTLYTLICIKNVERRGGGGEGGGGECV